MSRSRLVPLVLIALVAAACNNKHPGQSTSASGQPQASVSISAPPGSYVYDNYGIVATLIPQGDTWKLSVTNRTGQTQGKPGIYELDARDGKRIDGTVEGSTSLSNGQNKDFTVTFGQGFDRNNVGLMILLLGGENWGAFAAETHK